MDYAALKLEIDSDPLARGYSGLTDAQVANSLNAANRPDPDTPTDMNAPVIWNAVDPTEYDALSVENKALVDFIGNMSNGIPIASGLIKNKLFAVFGAGTTSRANIIALATRDNISRAAELKLGTVLESHVTVARAM